MQFNIKRVAREWKEREREERGREAERQRETEAKFTGKDKCQGLFFNKVAGHRCFYVNFMNI